MVTPKQGEIWWAEAEDKRRPVLIVTRSEAIPVLHVARRCARDPHDPRQSPTEIALGPSDGVPAACVASFDNIQPIRRVFLTERVGSIGERRYDICRALGALADC